MQYRYFFVFDSSENSYLVQVLSLCVLKLSSLRVRLVPSPRRDVVSVVLDDTIRQAGGQENQLYVYFGDDHRNRIHVIFHIFESRLS